MQQLKCRKSNMQNMHIAMGNLQGILEGSKADGRPKQCAKIAHWKKQLNLCSFCTSSARLYMQEFIQ
jgi:hypothetical protein